jgi:hypothetical protein
MRNVLAAILVIALFYRMLSPVPSFTTGQGGQLGSYHYSSNTIRHTKVLLYITTLYSDTHRRYLDCCWPSLLKQSQLLQNSHVMIFSNNLTEMDSEDTAYLKSVETLFRSHKVPSLEFKFANGTPELEMLRRISEEAKLNRNMTTNLKQWGANMALSIAFSAGWFNSYDWVVRVNPDVLIRRSDFIVDYLEDDSIDAVLAICGSKINTDFMALRPRAMEPRSFSRMYNNSAWTYNHEVTAKKNFLHLLDSKRFVSVPDLDPMNGKCRVRGDHAPVYHAHDSKCGFYLLEVSQLMPYMERDPNT